MVLRNLSRLFYSLASFAIHSITRKPTQIILTMCVVSIEQVHMVYEVYDTNRQTPIDPMPVERIHVMCVLHILLCILYR